MNRPEFAHATWGMEFYDLDRKQTIFAVNGRTCWYRAPRPSSSRWGRRCSTSAPTIAFTPASIAPARSATACSMGTSSSLHLATPTSQAANVLTEATRSSITITRTAACRSPPIRWRRCVTSRSRWRRTASRQVTGQVIVDASLFPEGERELGTRVVMSPMVVNDNVIDIVITAGVRAGEAATCAGVTEDVVPHRPGQPHDGRLGGAEPAAGRGGQYRPRSSRARAERDRPAARAGQCALGRPLPFAIRGDRAGRAARRSRCARDSATWRARGRAGQTLRITMPTRWWSPSTSRSR